MFVQQLANALTLGAIYALIALGYTMVYGVLGLINFAHSEIMMLGAFAALGAAAYLPAMAGSFWGLCLALTASMIVAGAVNVAVERFVYRPLRGSPRLTPLIAAIGVSIVLQNAVFLWVNTQSVSFPQPDAARAVLQFAGATVSYLQCLILGMALALMGLLVFLVRRTKVGKAMRACADDIATAGLMGIDSRSLVAMTFFIGGALGGAAGLLYGVNYGSIKYNLGFVPGMKAFTAAVLGGIGDIRGAVLGGFLLGLLEVFSSGYIPSGAQWRDVVSFGILIAVLLVRPRGILGDAAVEKI